MKFFFKKKNCKTLREKKGEQEVVNVTVHNFHFAAEKSDLRYFFSLSFFFLKRKKT